jgi:hypothetical protein
MLWRVLRFNVFLIFKSTGFQNMEVFRHNLRIMTVFVVCGAKNKISCSCVYALFVPNLNFLCTVFKYYGH